MRRRAAGSTRSSGSVLPEPLPKPGRHLPRPLLAWAYNGGMNTNRHVLALAALLAVTVLTGGAAILGIVHRSAPVVAPAAVQQVQPSAPAFYDDGGGD